MSESKPQLVHIEVDGSPELVYEWKQFIKNNPLEGYEFIVTGSDGTVRPVVEREEIVADIANAVAERLNEPQRDERR
jgi:hypothetical protein